MEFESPSARAKYCIYCRDKAQVLRNKAYKEKKQAGEAVVIKAYAKSLGMSVNKLLLTALEEYKEHHS
ncbi:MAG: hypothetical protein IK999_09735 [Ruminococcus sp.]|nr:hypothetical protein [Ruminococcus sp.]